MLRCPACNQDVGPIQGPTGMLHCPQCNLILGRGIPEAVVGRVAIKRVSASEMVEAPVVIGTTMIDERPLEPTPPTKPPGVRFGLAMISEDLELHRQLISDGLRERGLCAEVVASARGDRFLTAVTDHLLRRRPPDLCILDLEMPGLSGYHTALSLRAIERAFNVPHAPILFFSARVCDETFKRAMEEIGHAGYLNKGGSAPGEFFGRLEQVLRTFHGEPALDEAKPA